MAKIKYHGSGYQTTKRHQLKPKEDKSFQSEPSRVMILFNALNDMINWDTASQEVLENYLIVKKHNRYWTDKFAGYMPEKPEQEINWDFYKTIDISIKSEANTTAGKDTKHESALKLLPIEVQKSMRGLPIVIR